MEVRGREDALGERARRGGALRVSFSRSPFSLSFWRGSSGDDERTALMD